MIGVFIAYLVVLLVIVAYSARRSKTNTDFVLGGKKINGFSLALSERATGESAWLLLGLTGHAYAEGLSSIWVAIGCVSGIFFIWAFMAEPLRKFTEKYQALTVPGLFSKRFPGNEKAFGMISSAIIIIFFLLYIAAQFSGAGKIFHDTFGLSPLWGMLIGSLLVTVYTMLGGFITVVATDAFQAILMVVTCVVLPIIAFFVAAHHNVDIAAAISSSSFTTPINASAGTSIGALLILNGLSWAFGYTGQPQLLTRMMALKNKSDRRTAQWVAVIWTSLAYAGAFLIGLIGYELVKAGALGEVSAKLAADAEKIMPVMVMSLFTPILAGILLSGAVSAMMSTASSQLMVCSSSMSEDLYEPMAKRKISQKRMLRLNKILTLAVGFVAFLLAISMEDTVYGLVSYAWSGIGASFGPAIVLLLFWKKLSRAGVFASLIGGTLSAIIWKTFLVSSTGISERLSSYVIAFALAILFSIIYPEKK
ncbi:sodium/proline symporter [Marinifilum caeruleilacunae]|uniref:Sodium/proline symporter n=1 Tax=Marinifilum caeruleilacunae TaxID=2499076 RepID=A0ABX1WTI2_9BACT|nr:sodium/proline symporter [Marinifilum caeruleilacunae]NOU59400.1 sodium/proline symporter [Marinifilum caeruleilacunae]